ncbi:MAG: hypothetical protein Q8L55_04835 [Phycisphaerales bacterium]|nr:hypothetical protein [Phycisphaerales bacterium]
MNEKRAEALAAALGGEAWQSGGGIWLVTLNVGGKVVAFSGDCICEYQSEEAFDESRASKTIELTVPEDDERWVIVDQDGTVFYANNEFELGWDDEGEARREARGLESRGEGRWQVVRAEEIEETRAYT